MTDMHSQLSRMVNIIGESSKYKGYITPMRPRSQYELARSHLAMRPCLRDTSTTIVASTRVNSAGRLLGIRLRAPFTSEFTAYLNIRDPQTQQLLSLTGVDRGLVRSGRSWMAASPTAPRPKCSK
jgi:hypothetical protein